MTPFTSFALAARHAAADSPTGLALVDGASTWTWRELDERADAVARALVDAEVTGGDRVALAGQPTAAVIAALHGIARVGAVVAPLGAGLTTAELAAAAEVIDPRVVIDRSELGAVADATGRPATSLDDLLAAERAFEPFIVPMPDPAAPAAVVLTSGTSGLPKAAILSAAAMTASAEAWLAALPPVTGWLLAVGLGHVAGLGIAWRAALAAVPLVVLPRPDPSAIVEALVAPPAPSHVSLVPTTLIRVLDTVGDGPPPPTLRAVLLGGGPIPADLVRRAVRAGWPVVPTYGLSEAGSGVTALPTREAADHPDSAGGPLPGVRIRIAEADQDGVGEILVLTPARFSGYLGDPDASAAALTDDGWLRTGDLGRLDADGRLTVLDRRTDRIVRGGENVSPAEVEAVLAGHPAIAEVAVVARRDATFGQAPVAAIVLRDGVTDPGDDALTRFARERLAGFKVPAAFIRRDSLPRTAGGKLRRVELRTSLDPAPLVTEESDA